MLLIGAEKIETEQDLDAVERIAWGALVPDFQLQKKNKQDLRKHRVYLWSNDSPARWLETRIKEDKAALATWLQSPLPTEGQPADELARYQTVYAIETAMAETQHPEPDEDPSRIQLMRQTKQSLRDIRWKLINRLDGNANTVERSLLSSLSVLESGLLHGLRPHLKNNQLSQCDKAKTEVQLRKIVEAYISKQADLWEQDANSKLLSYESDVINDSLVLLDNINWQLINELPGQTVDMTEYPQALHDNLLPDKAGQMHNVMLRDASHKVIILPMNFRHTGSIKLMPRMAIGGAITSLVAFLFRMGLPGVVIGSVIGVVGTALFDQRARTKHNLNACEQYGRLLIQESVKSARQLIQEQIQDDLKKLRNHLNKEFDILEDMLDRAINNSCLPAEGYQTSGSALEQLQEYWRRVNDLDLAQS